MPDVRFWHKADIPEPAELIDELQEALTDVSFNDKRRSEITELMDTLRGNLEKVVQHGKRADAIANHRC